MSTGVSTGPCIQAFADDTLLICGTDDPGLLLEISSFATSTIIRHLENKGLHLNLLKSEALLYNKMLKWRILEPLEGDPNHLQVQVGNTLIEPSASLKLLGVNMDSSLSWSNHIQAAIKKANAALPTMVAICQNLFGYSYQARRVMIQGCVLTHLTYCSSVFYHRVALQSNRKAIDQLQCRANHLISRSYRTVSFATS